jgi:hypothetical protein
MPDPITERDRQAAIKAVIDNNLSYRQAETLTGVSKTRIHELVQEVKANPELTLFRDNKAGVFESLQAKLISLADDDLLKTMLSKRGFTDAAILEDKIRLIRGQATSISAVDIRQLIASVSVDNPVDNNEPNDIV